MKKKIAYALSTITIYLMTPFAAHFLYRNKKGQMDFHITLNGKENTHEIDLNAFCHDLTKYPTTTDKAKPTKHATNTSRETIFTKNLIPGTGLRTVKNKKKHPSWGIFFSSNKSHTFPSEFNISTSYHPCAILSNLKKRNRDVCLF